MMMEVDVGFVFGSVLGALCGVAFALLIDAFRVGRVIEDYNALEQEVWAWESDVVARKEKRREDE